MFRRLPSVGPAVGAFWLGWQCVAVGRRAVCLGMFPEIELIAGSRRTLRLHGANGALRALGVMMQLAKGRWVPGRNRLTEPRYVT